MDGNCSRCGADGPVAYGEFRQTLGTPGNSQINIYEGDFCPRCTRKTCMRASLGSLILGWWSGPGFFATPWVISRNFAMRKQMQQEFSGFEPTKAVDLPWGNLLTNSRVRVVEEEPLTMSQAIGTLSAVAGTVCLIAVIAVQSSSRHFTPEQALSIKRWSILGVAVFAILLYASIRWYRAFHVLEEDVEDLLARLFPPVVIFQRRCIQVAGFAAQIGGSIRINIVMQNFSTGTATFRANVGGLGFIPVLESYLLPGEVAVFWKQAAIPDHANDVVPIAIRFDVTTDGLILPHNGRRSFRRRRAGLMVGPANPVADTVLLAGPAQKNPTPFMNARGEFEIPLDASARYAPPDHIDWARFALGRMDNVKAAEEASFAIRDLLGLAPVLEVVA